MKKLEDFTNIKAVIIPTCDYTENIIRADRAIEFINEYNLPKRCIVAGSGTDTSIALGCEKNPGKEQLDFHEGLYNYLMYTANLRIGIDIRSVNSIENILEVFPKGMIGKYAIVSYPLHLMRFKRIVDDAKKAGKVSKNLEVIYIPTKQRMKWIPHEILSNIKYYTKGKRKYFGNSKIIDLKSQ